MTGRNIYGRTTKEQHLGKARRELGLCAVLEEDAINDLADGRGEPEGDIRNAGERFDIRDLLLDESD